MKKIILHINKFFLICILNFAINIYATNAMANKYLIGQHKNAIINIENYLNNIKTIVATFTQTTANGGVSEGMFYLSKPGKLRWEYYMPNPIVITAKGSLLTYFDVELDQVSHVKADDTLSGFLTKEKITFDNDDIVITNINNESDLTSITMHKKDERQDGEITLSFSTIDNQLKAISVKDALEKDIDIKFNNVVYDKPLDKKLFSIPKFRRN